MSALITRASISSVTPGSVAARAPASVAALRAAVWESDWTVGARTTSGRQHRSGDRRRAARRAWEPRSAITASTASAPASCAASRSRSPIRWVAGLQITSTSSPSRTPRQSRMTALTA